MPLASPRPASLAAAPARVTLTGAEQRTIRVTNSGGAVTLLDVAPAGFALDPRGRPRIVPRSDAVAARLVVQPRQLALKPGEASTLVVSAAIPTHAQAGDHPALVLLTTRPRPGSGLGVRLQIGIVVMVRVPGAVTHRLDVRRLRVRRVHGADLIELAVLNRGNVTERLGRGRVLVTLRRRGRVIARLATTAREVFPRAVATQTFRYAGRFRGLVTALVAVARPASGVPVLRRSYRIRL